METTAFIKQCLVTLSPAENNMEQLEHSMFGIVTEAGELLDTMKKHKYYKRKLDISNVIEEIGDVLYYVAVACNALNIEFEDCFKLVTDKLKLRYGDKFNSSLAADRNLVAEKQLIDDFMSHLISKLPVDIRANSVYNYSKTPSSNTNPDVVESISN